MARCRRDMAVQPSIKTRGLFVVSFYVFRISTNFDHCRTPASRFRLFVENADSQCGENRWLQQIYCKLTHPLSAKARTSGRSKRTGYIVDGVTRKTEGLGVDKILRGQSTDITKKL